MSRSDNLMTLAGKLIEIAKGLAIPEDRELIRETARHLIQHAEPQLTPIDKLEFVRLVHVGIESGLMRDGFHELGVVSGLEDMINRFWTPGDFAERQARVIAAALLGEFVISRRSTDSPQPVNDQQAATPEDSSET